MEKQNSVHNPFFTIIVPVYKVEKYLPRCMTSILNQDFESYEVILVDDGSPDLSGAMCDEYASRDSKIKVIHKDNGGQASARNLGLTVAKGEYTVFVDSDDELAPNTLKQVADRIQAIGGCDMLQVSAVAIDDKTGKIISEINVENMDGTMTGVDFMKKTLRSTYASTVWDYIFHTDLLKKRGLSFMEGVFHEDEEFIPRVLLCACRVTTCDICHYHYYIRDNSTMTKKNQTKNSEDLLTISRSLENEFAGIADKELRRMLLDRLVSFQLTAFIIGKRIFRDNGIDKGFLKKYAYSKSNRLKVAIYCGNKNLLYWLEILFLKVKRLFKKVELN